jgi:hypothetical protein
VLFWPVYGLGSPSSARDLHSAGILVSIPGAAPFILLGLGIWWLVRRSKRGDAPAASVEDTAVK